MHPIVTAIGPNEEQLPAVLDRGRDIVVTAGAGTGKTRTLVSRYLSLLAGGMPIRSIVAITFTVKAAREMRNRVREAMRSYLQHGDLSQEERLFWSDSYNQLDAARIGTIHSLATELLRAHPAEAGLDPRFEVLDEGDTGILTSQAIQEGLAWAADDEQSVRLFSYLGERKLRSVIEELMRSRLEAQEALDHLPDPLWPVWQELMAQELMAFVNDSAVRSAFDDLQALKMDGAIQRANGMGDALAPLLEEMLRIWEQIQEYWTSANWAGIVGLLQPLRGLMKTNVGRKGSWEPADPKAAVKEIQAYFDETLGSFIKGKFNIGLDQDWAWLLPALARLFERVTQRYSVLKGFGLKLDFDDLESCALSVLQNHQEVRERWQEDIKAILVDEFQDTNGRQRDLVNLLTGSPGKLFIVGDAKQSIYRFRGAEVAVFRAERSRIDRGQGIAFELSTSYRAHRDLLAGLNNLLEPVLGSEEDPSRPWREPFGALRHHREDPMQGITAPYIELHLTAGTKSDGSLSFAAEALVGHIITLVEAEDSSVRYGDVAILCRASTSFSAYETALDRANVPYLTVSGRGFYDRPEIRDLLNMLYVISDPVDDLALTGMLRSPVIGLSDMELFELFQQWEEVRGETSLWQFIQGYEKPKVSHAVKIIAALHALSGRIPVASILEELINRTDYKAALLGSSNARAARNVSKLLVDAHNSAIVGVGDFLSYIQGLRSGQAREGEAPAITGDAVRIMTIHAAKGLEFPVVVIGDINYGRNRGADLLIDPDLGVFPKLTDDDSAGSYMFELLQRRDRDQEDAESDRLLYVAATRAQDKLILSGTFKFRQNGTPGWLRGWLKKLDEPLGLSQHEIRYNEEGSRVRKSTLKMGSNKVGCLVYEPWFKPTFREAPAQKEALLFDDWTDKLLEDFTKDQAVPVRPDDDSSQLWYVFGDKRPRRAPRTVIGLLVHEALEAWRFPDSPDFEKWLQARIASQGLVGQDQSKDAFDRVVTLLARFQAHALYGVISSAERLFREVPYDYGENRSKEDHGRIDLLYLKNGLWTIVDFKTDELGSDIALKEYIEAEKYNLQLARYENAVARLIRHRPRALLCFLDHEGKITLVDRNGRTVNC